MADSPYLSPDALRRFHGGRPPGSDLAGPTRADVYWPPMQGAQSDEAAHAAHGEHVDQVMELVHWWRGLQAIAAPMEEQLRILNLLRDLGAPDSLLEAPQ